jgi:hypothetical protein
MAIWQSGSFAVSTKCNRETVEITQSIACFRETALAFRQFCRARHFKKAHQIVDRPRAGVAMSIAA